MSCGWLCLTLQPYGRPAPGPRAKIVMRVQSYVSLLIFGLEVTGAVGVLA
ncbi:MULTISPECIES: hypothetical protein [Streptomyces]|nr:MULTISPECIES: hypothetical protein [Streptomyces]MBX9420944.1 hypothetical protein [Streptomyces lateritius]